MLTPEEVENYLKKLEGKRAAGKWVKNIQQQE
jgi:hypothetical protein